MLYVIHTWWDSSVCCFIHMHLFASLMQQLGKKKQPSVAAQKLSAQRKRKHRIIQGKWQAPVIDFTLSDLPGNHSDANGLWKRIGDVNLFEASRYYINSEIHHYVVHHHIHIVHWYTFTIAYVQWSIAKQNNVDVRERLECWAVVATVEVWHIWPSTHRVGRHT